MNYKALINAILIILLLHLLIKNIHFKKIFFNSNETFISNPTSPCYNELLDYVKGCDNDDGVKAGNYYVENDNNPNFTSNVLNVHKFYDREIEKNYDNLDLSEFENISSVKEQECFPPRNLHNNPKSVNTYPKPDQWNYRNELPMNGGSVVGNVVGFDTLNDGYSMFNQNVEMINPKCDSDMYFDDTCKTVPDDIRFGLGYPNAERRATT